MFSDVKSFLLQKFWTPIVDESVYYNPFNTALYAFLFSIAALYLVYPLSKEIGIDFNQKFFLGISPYIVLGGLGRSLKDVNVINSILLETPFIYIIMFLLTLGSLLITKKIGEIKNVEYHKLFGLVGALLVIFTLSLYSVSNYSALFYFMVSMAAWIIPLCLAAKFLKPELFSYSFLIPVGAHYFDASTTSVSLLFGGAEKHVVAQLFIENFGLTGMFLMKTLFIIPIVYYILENIEGEEKNYYLFLIAGLGIAIGTRNLISLIAV